MPISDCWPALETSLELLDPPTHTRITSLHQHLLPHTAQIERYASSLHPRKAPCRMITDIWTWGQSFLVYELVFEGLDGEGDLDESWVARFGLPPYEGDEFFNTPEQLERKILNEVGALRIVKERTTVPVPEIFGFSARHGVDFQHVFGAPAVTPPHPHVLGEQFPAFILMSAMRGKTIEDCGIPTHELGGHWDTPTSDPSYQAHLDSDILRRYLASLADIHVQLSRVTFPQIGSFTLDNGGDVRIGPMAEFGLGPFDTAEEYYAVMAEAFKRIAESAVVDDDDDDDEEEEQEGGEGGAGGRQQVPINESISLSVSEITKLRRAFAASLFPDALRPHLSAANNHGPFPLRHGDLHSENLLVDENTGEIIGVIDWEGAGTVPWEVAGALNWEVQGEVLETNTVPGLGLVRPEIHAAFNRALKDAEEEAELRAVNAARRRQIRSTSASLRLSLVDSRGSVRRSSTASSSLSEYATPKTSFSPSSSSASLVSSSSKSHEAPKRHCHSGSSSSTSSNPSFTSFGNFSAIDDFSSTIGSQSNLTLASPLTSPATSMFEIHREELNAVKKGSNSPTTTPKAERRFGPETGPGKLMSWLGFSRAASEGTPRTPPPVFSLLQHSPPATPSSPTSRPSNIILSTTPSTSTSGGLSTPMIEAIREPIPFVPTKSAITKASKTESHKADHEGEGLSLSLAAMAIAESSLSPKHAKSPVMYSPSPSPRTHAHARYNSMSMHRRQRSSMVLSIPNPNQWGVNHPETHHTARLTPSASPMAAYIPMLGPGLSMHRSRSPSPSPGSSPNPRARPLALSPHAKRPSSFYVPGSMNARSLSTGSTAASASPTVGSYFPPQLRAKDLGAGHTSESTIVQAPSKPDLGGGVLGAGLSSTPTILTPATSPTKEIGGGASDLKSVLKLPSVHNIGAVAAPSGQTLSELHAHAGSYVAGYLGHWMFVLGCEWDTVGRALWDIIVAQKALESGEDSKGGKACNGEEEEAEEDPHLEKAFLNWIANVWAVEQAQRDDE